MDAARALADLTEISSQIQGVVLIGEDGGVLGTTLGDDERARRFAELAGRLLDEAASAEGASAARVAQLEAATPEGSVFVVREGGSTIAATTSPDPTVGLVFYDLRSCLRSLAADDEEEPRGAA